MKVMVLDVLQNVTNTFTEKKACRYSSFYYYTGIERNQVMNQYAVVYRSTKDDLRKVVVESASALNAGDVARTIRDDIQYIVTVNALPKSENNG